MDTCKTCGEVGSGCTCPDLMGFLMAFREAPHAAPGAGDARVLESRAGAEGAPPAPPSPSGPPAEVAEAAPEAAPGPGRAAPGPDHALPSWPPPDFFPAEPSGPGWTSPERVGPGVGPPGVAEPGVAPLAAWPPPMAPIPSWSPPAGAAWSPPAGPAAPPGVRPGWRSGRWPVVAGVAAVAVIAAVVAVLAVPSRSGLAGLSGASVMQKALAAATRAGSARLEGFQVQGGQTTTGTIDFTASGGTATFSYGGQTMTVLYVDGSLYIRAGAALLGQDFQVPGPVAARYADRWIMVPTDDPAAQQMAGELRTSVVVSDLLTLAGPITRAGPHGPGQVAVQGRLAHNQYNDGSGAGDLTTLTVSTRAPFYPAAISYSDPTNGSTNLSFSHWGEKVALHAPADPVPLVALGVGATSSAPAAPDESTAPAPSITATSPQAGLAVTPAQARTVGTGLWTAWVQARATRDVTALQTLDMQPMLAADWGYVCQFGCHGPQLGLSTLTVTVPRQSGWPAHFLANATYTPCQTPVTPCDDTFVAVQAAPGAPWKIASMADWTGTSYATIPPAGSDQLSPDPTPPPGSDVSALPEAYAQYLQAIKTNGAPPAGTRLGPGPFTSGLISSNYLPASEQQAEGQTVSVAYRTSPSDPIWQFAGRDGTTEVCGTVRFTDVRRETTVPLVQSAAVHPYGDLAAGVYSSVTLTGLHLVCFEVYADAARPVAVIGTWGDIVTATGTPIQAAIEPA